MDADLVQLGEELRSLGFDYGALMRCAERHGFCAAFTPASEDGEPALAFGVWTGLSFDRSECAGHRAAAAVLYCSRNSW